MAMKKTSGGNSPLRQGAGKASGPSRSSGQRWRRIAMCSGKLIGYLGFSRRGVFIGKGAMSKVGPGGLTPWRRGQGLGCANHV
jgi:hypothetical protein